VLYPVHGKGCCSCCNLDVMAAVCVSKCITRVLLKKPFSVVTVEKENSSGNIKRHLSLLDLLSIGIGGTVGSGVFVLSGLIARNYAGKVRAGVVRCGVVW
jgi:hypothetical protein